MVINCGYPNIKFGRIVQHLVCDLYPIYRKNKSGRVCCSNKRQAAAKRTAKFAMFKDGAQIVHIIGAIIDSAQQGKWVVVK
ncbi:hypothetical protein P7M01_06925 [Bisgaard Taxon 10/6]|uniref:hypothetical protein n=1 Tax=Exercitatus varius TaxID=67857 RepID=UPI00294B5580|nr:hypothetical protein [Exercitatus varius]MDG2964776.1 hypothetical protein [Exercitatus varius]